MRDVPPNYRAGNNNAFEFHQRLEAGPGQIWILTTDNSYRPYSVESAMCKGGVDINSGLWGDSPYIASIFPRFHCNVIAWPTGMTSKEKQRVTEGTIGFARLTTESLQLAMSRVEHSFGISLRESSCHEVVSSAFSWFPPMIYCYPKNHIISA